jgi:hypothetical protein
MYPQILSTWCGYQQRNFESPATLAIDHFWRWISTSASHLHDPNIYRFIHGLYEENVHPEAG